jgi:hypothetical protein
MVIAAVGMALAALFAVALGAHVAGAASPHGGGGGLGGTHQDSPRLRQPDSPVWHWPAE